MLKGFKIEQLISIGYSFVLDELDVKTPYGRDRKKRIQLFEIHEEDELLLAFEIQDKIQSLLSNKIIIFNDLEELLLRFKEIRGTLRKLQDKDVSLSEVELFGIKNFAIDCIKLKDLIDSVKMDLRPFSMVDLTNILKLLNPGEIINRSFYIYEDYSEELQNIRKNKKALDNCDESPLQRAKIVELEREEEDKIRERLTRTIAGQIKSFESNIEYISELDFVMAKVRLNRKFGGVRPHISKDISEIFIKEAYNPYYSKIIFEKGSEFTPVNMDISQGANVITGANMGGKSVALATVTLNLILAMSGFYVFAKELRLPHLNYIVFLSDDLQSVKRGLSTFGAEVVELVSLIDNMKNKKGFAALDEFARGTNPTEGANLVKGFLKFAQSKDSYILVSTHYSGVMSEGMTHFQVVGLKNADLNKLDILLNKNSDSQKERSFDIIQEFMDYNIEKIAWDSSPPRDAMKIAKLLGLEEEFLTD